MGIFFSGHRKKGITKYELEHEHILNHFDAVLQHHSRKERDRRRAVLHNALELALDRDPNMSHSQRGGLIQADEFQTIVDGLLKSGELSSTEATHLKKIAEQPLSD